MTETGIRGYVHRPIPGATVEYIFLCVALQARLRPVRRCATHCQGQRVRGRIGVSVPIRHRTSRHPDRHVPVQPVIRNDGCRPAVRGSVQQVGLCELRHRTVRHLKVGGLEPLHQLAELHVNPEVSGHGRCDIAFGPDRDRRCGRILVRNDGPSCKPLPFGPRISDKCCLPCVAQPQFDRFQAFAYRVLEHRNADRLGCFARQEGERSVHLGVVLAGGRRIGLGQVPSFVVHRHDGARMRMAQRHHEIQRRAGSLDDLGIRNRDHHAFNIVAP